MKVIGKFPSFFQGKKKKKVRVVEITKKRKIRLGKEFPFDDPPAIFRIDKRDFCLEVKHSVSLTKTPNWIIVRENNLTPEAIHLIGGLLAKFI